MVAVAPISVRMSSHGDVAEIAARRMVVDDDVGLASRRQRVVAGARLRVDHGDDCVRAPVEPLDGHQIDLELAHHGAILGAPDDAADGDRRRNARLLEEPAQPERRCQRVGIGVVVRHDRGTAAVGALLQRGQPARQVEGHGLASVSVFAPTGNSPHDTSLPMHDFERHVQAAERSARLRVVDFPAQVERALTRTGRPLEVEEAADTRRPAAARPRAGRARAPPSTDAPGSRPDPRRRPSRRSRADRSTARPSSRRRSRSRGADRRARDSRSSRRRRSPSRSRPDGAHQAVR